VIKGGPIKGRFIGGLDFGTYYKCGGTYRDKGEASRDEGKASREVCEVGGIYLLAAISSCRNSANN
jgi:hypothetical protein